MIRISIYKVLSIIVFALLYLFTALMIIAGFPFMLLRAKGIVRSMMRFWATSVFLLMGMKIEVTGLENLLKSKRFILVANHSSLFDIIAIVSIFPDLAWFGHERLMKIPVFRQVLVLTDYIPMRKATIRNTREMVNQLIERSRKRNIAIFPEGTRTLDGRMSDFYRGFIILVRSTSTDVLPVTLNGFYSLKPKNRSYIDFSSKLSVIIHEPFSGEFLKSKSDGEIAGIIRSRIESAHIDLASPGEELSGVSLKSSD
ncbi:MAG: lysophospholipid acyltransferase family protein [Bacteroidales bacterium]